MSKGLGAVHIYSFEFFFLSLVPVIIVFIISLTNNYDRTYQPAFTLTVYVFVLGTLNALLLVGVSQLQDDGVTTTHMSVSHATFASFFSAIILYTLQETSLNMASVVTVSTIPLIFFVPCLIGCFKSTPENIKVPLWVTREGLFFCALMIPFFHDTKNDLYTTASIQIFWSYFGLPFALYCTLLIASFIAVQMTAMISESDHNKYQWVSFVTDVVLGILVSVYGVLCWARTGVFSGLSDTVFFFVSFFYVLAFCACFYSISKSATKIWKSRNSTNFEVGVVVDNNANSNGEGSVEGQPVAPLPDPSAPPFYSQNSQKENMSSYSFLKLNTKKKEKGL